VCGHQKDKTFIAKTCSTTKASASK